MMSGFPPADHVGVKICGITREDQAHEIVAAGADALGVNLWEKSKRHLPLAEARRWLPALRGEIYLVAVVVNPPAALLDEIVRAEVFDAIQFHGDETPEIVMGAAARGVDVIKALQVRDAESLDEIAKFPCETILLDAYNPGLYGGGGTAFPWALMNAARERYPEKRFILAGGLTPENVREAVEQTCADAVDVASGVESAPGIKDMEMVRRFVNEARV